MVVGPGLAVGLAAAVAGPGQPGPLRSEPRQGNPTDEARRVQLEGGRSSGFEEPSSHHASLL